MRHLSRRMTTLLAVAALSLTAAGCADDDGVIEDDGGIIEDEGVEDETTDE